MFNLIYLVLGIYVIKLIVIKASMYHKNRSDNRNKDNISRENFAIKFKKGFSGFKERFKEKNNIFIFNNKIREINNSTIKLENDEIRKAKRQVAFENAKYKCEECGNIANLEVYSKYDDSFSDDLIVLCKNCYKEYLIKTDLHYEQ